MARAARRVASRLERVLRIAQPRLGAIYSRALSDTAYLRSEERESEPEFIDVKSFESAAADAISIIDVVELLSGKLKRKPDAGVVVDLDKPEVLQVTVRDIGDDRTGEILVVSEGDLDLSYGDRGLLASPEKKPTDLLIHSKLLSGKHIRAVRLEEHVPFLIKKLDPRTKGFVFAACDLERVLDHKDNISRYSVDKIITMPPDTAKIVSLEIQRAIFTDKTNEKFFEETTSRIFSPKEHMRSSGTFMNFERREFGVDSTTDMHFHPGERLLFIYTTEREAGATLNFCGVLENPDKRPDCEVKISFAPNSIYALRFPPFCHHKFHGTFDCISVHPKDGLKMTESLERGSLTGGFLESATTFSVTDIKEQEWSLGDNSPTKTKPLKSSYHRDGGRS